MRLDDGLVFLSDTRTNAGVDNINTYRKLHVPIAQPDRLVVLQSAGNLATTQQVLDMIRRDLAAHGDHQSLATVSHLFEAALYVGRLSREVQSQHQAALGGNASATFIVGGQIAGEDPDIFLVYPEGNYIRASDELPFLQIGESKYGKHLLELAVHAQVDIVTAGKIALSSMVTTARANLSVGPPYDAAMYQPGSFRLWEHRVEHHSPFLAELDAVWARHVLAAIADLPPIPVDLL